MGDGHEFGGISVRVKEMRQYEAENWQPNQGALAESNGDTSDSKGRRRTGVRLRPRTVFRRILQKPGESVLEKDVDQRQ